MRYREEITDSMEDAINDLDMLDKLLSKSAITGKDAIQRVRNIKKFVSKAKERIEQN